jgi:diacylglycerol kinase family enzyme
MIVLLNSLAGTSAKEGLATRVADQFRNAGVEAEIREFRNGVELSTAAAEVGNHPSEIVVAGGGDGTISAVASALIGTNKTLGVLPLGTLNHFAKDLGIPLDLEGAVRTVVQGTGKAVDVGEVNERYFLNNSSIGLYPEIVSRREREQQVRNVGKWHAMLRAFVAALREYRFVHVHVRTPAGEFHRTTPFVFIGNNQYSLDALGFGGRAALDRGTLCFWLARRTPPLGIVRLGLRALVGMLRGARDFEAHCGPSFDVVPRDTRVRVALDGETVVMKAPLHYRSRPGALRVMVPPKPA